MKNKIINFGQDCWQMLTEIPGWPDAPKAVRIRRSLPILVPFVLILLLLAWNKGVRDPYMQHERALHQALLDQERELDALRLGVSNQQAEDLAKRSAQVEKQILKNPADLAPILAQFKTMANEAQWEGNFQASDLSSGTAPEADTPLVFLYARAKLISQPGNSEAFSSLLALVDRVSAFEKRIDLTRLGIRADDEGRYTAELNFRLLRRNSHEKTPE